MRLRFISLLGLIGAVGSGCGEASSPPGTTSTGSGGNAAAGASAEAGKSPIGMGGSAAAGAGASPGGGASGAASTGGSSAGGGGAGGAGAASGGATAGGASAGGGGAGGGTSGGSGGTAGSSDPDRCQLAEYDAAAPPRVLELKGNLGTHDPVIASAEGKFFLFSTGDNLGAKSSTDLLTWQAEPEVFRSATRPAWLAQNVPGVMNLWAPDISYFGGAYHLYYSASTFGSNRSCIGHLSRASLTTGSWKDEGPVVCSNVGTSDDYNAIDPNVIVDTDGTPWLSFGSFWSGIKLIELDAKGAREGTSLDAIAARPSAGGALEAPFIVRRCGYYYLFMSWDRCCQGSDSTYNTRVGRATAVRGPYVDKSGKALLEGGGTLLVEGNTRYRGPGHNAVLFTETGAYNVYHAYDANQNGAAILRIAELAWDAEGWPVSAGP